MKFKVLLAGSLAIALSAPAFATDDGKEKSEVKQKKICRTETDTASMLGMISASERVRCRCGSSVSSASQCRASRPPTTRWLTASPG